MHVVPFLSYVFVTTFTPGPNNIMAMVNAEEHGLRKTMRFTCGVAAGFFVIMLLCSYFNLLLLSLIPKIELVMTIVGGIYMVYLAVKIVFDKPHGDGNHKRLNSFTSGLVLQFVNPKVILYGITALSTFIIPFHKSSLSLTLFSLFLAFVGLLSTSCWAMFGSLFQKWNHRYRLQFNVVMGLLLIYSAISLFV